MAKILVGKSALVTGSTRGIGRLVAVGLAKHGCKRVICHGRSAQGCQKTADEVRSAGAEAIVIPAELDYPLQVEELADKVLKLGGVDILYNNAAVMHPWREHAEDLRQEDWTWSFQVNLFAITRLTSLLLPPMRKNGWGRIVNVTSGIDKTPQLAAYGASKWALDKWTDDLAAGLKHSGIIVSRMDPGWLRTDLGGPNGEHEPESVLPGALVPVVLPDGSKSGQFFRAQELRDYVID